MTPLDDRPGMTPEQRAIASTLEIIFSPAMHDIAAWTLSQCRADRLNGLRGRAGMKPFEKTPRPTEIDSGDAKIILANLKTELRKFIDAN